MLDLEEIRLDDEKTWDLIGRGHTKGVFQFETYLGQTWCKEIKPRCIEDLSDISAALRPGSLKSKDKDGKSMTWHYAERKSGREEVASLYGPIDHIIKSTQGIILYQEQSMRIAVEMAGFTGVQSNALRKAIGKKKADLMKQIRKEFIDGCIQQGHQEEIANRIFDIVQESQRYSFNKSHSVAYSVESYKSAYLKANYPLQFYVERLDMAKNNISPAKEIKELVESAKIDGIYPLIPSIERLIESFDIIDGKICFGITNIKNVGTTEFKKLLNLNDKIDFSSWTATLINVLIHINKRSVNNMIKTGVFSVFKRSRSIMLHEFSCLKDLTKKELGILPSVFDRSISLIENLKNLNRRVADGGIASSDKRIQSIEQVILRLSTPGRSLHDDPVNIAINEEDLLGVAISYSKLDGCADASHANTYCIDVVNGKKGKMVLAVEVVEAKEHIDKNGKTMCFLTVRDDTAKLENVVIFSSIYEEVEDIIYNDSTILLFCAASKDGGGILVDKAVSI